MDTKKTVLYAPSLIYKIYIFPFLIASPLFVIYSAYQLYTMLTCNYSVGAKLFLSYSTTFMLVASIFFAYISLITLRHFKYTITMDENNVITYKKSDEIVKEFTFFDIESITERKMNQEFIFNLKDGMSLPLPFEFKNHDFFFDRLFNNYKKTFSSEELNHTYTYKENKWFNMSAYLFLYPIIFLPLLLVSKYLIVLYVLAIGKVVYFYNETKYIKITPDHLEIKNNFKKSIFLKSEIKEIKFTRLSMKNSPYYRCILITNTDQQYKLVSSEISSIDLYCLLIFWQKNQT